jgi:hypothetical protein
MRASHDHYPVPLSRRAVGRVLEIQAGAMGLVVRDYLAVNRRIYPSRHFSRFLIISRRRGAPAPFQYKVTQLQASLAAAKQQVEILKSNYEQATANVSGLTTQVAYNKKRLADIQTLAADEASTQFQAQDKQVQYETVSAQLGAAKAAQQSQNSHWIPRSAASTPRSRSFRRSSTTQNGNCPRRTFARPPMGMSPSSH